MTEGLIMTNKTHEPQGVLNRLKEQKGVFPELGSIVWRSVCNIEIPRKELVARVNWTGLDGEYLVPGIDPSGAVRKSLDSLGLSKSDYLIDKVRSDEDTLAYQLCQKIPDKSALRTEYPQVQCMVYDRKAKTARCTSGLYETELLRAFDRFRDELTANEVRLFVSNAIMHAHGILAHPRGGVYFVPVQSKDTLEALEQIVADLKNGSFVFSLGIADHSKSRGNMLKVFVSEITEEMEKLELDVNDVTSRSAKPETLQRRIAEFHRVRAKAKTYVDLIGFEQEDLVNKLATLEAQVQKAIEG
jgi:hypothetical protein